MLTLALLDTELDLVTIDEDLAKLLRHQWRQCQGRDASFVPKADHGKMSDDA